MTSLPPPPKPPGAAPAGPIDRLNDGSAAPPRLRRDLNLGTLLALPPGSRGHRDTLAAQLAMLRADGWEAVQHWDGFEAIQAAGLRDTGMARITEPAQADAVAREHRARGVEATTLHLGTGFEDDDEADRLVAAVLEASARHGHAMFVETHRATLTQDIWRTLQRVRRFPALRFNADLSHWYAGHELTYGGEFDQRSEQLAPVLQRTRFMHGRIASSGAIQVAADAPGPATAHFRRLWQACCEGFLDGAGPGDLLPFAPELLPERVGDGADAMWLQYAQVRPHPPDDPLRGEPTDRYAEAEALWRLASEAFEAARQALAIASPADRPIDRPIDRPGQAGDPPCAR